MARRVAVYRAADVDRFVAWATARIEGLQRRVQDAEQLRCETTEATARLLIQAQRVADETIAAAHRDAAEIRAGAAREAASTIAAARLQLRELVVAEQLRLRAALAGVLDVAEPPEEVETAVAPELPVVPALPAAASDASATEHFVDRDPFADPPTPTDAFFADLREAIEIDGPLWHRTGSGDTTTDLDPVVAIERPRRTRRRFGRAVDAIVIAPLTRG